MDFINEELKTLLKKSTFFQALDHSDLNSLLQNSQQILLNEGDVLFQKGDSADAVYMVLSGLMEAMDNSFSLRKIKKGIVFGEFAILANRPRSATLYARSRTKILKFTAHSINDIVLNNNKTIRGVLSGLIERILKEEQKNLMLLQSILPIEVAYELSEKGVTEVRHFSNASVLFADVKGFSTLASKVSPKQLIKELDYTFGAFDIIISKYGLERIKTIGDCYMCAGGLPKENSSHAIELTLSALEMQNWIKEQSFKRRGNFWNIRVGINTGEVVAGVIGKTKFAYDIWGNTVNLASRMESTGETGKVHISKNTYNQINKYFSCTSRGEVEAKNIGKVETYFVDHIKPEYAKDQDSSVASQFFLEEISKLKKAKF